MIPVWKNIDENVEFYTHFARHEKKAPTYSRNLMAVGFRHYIQRERTYIYIYVYIDRKRHECFPTDVLASASRASRMLPSAVRFYRALALDVDVVAFLFS